MSVETVSRRYATALADAVRNSGDIETVKSELLNWQKMIKDNHDLQSAFYNPAIASADKVKVLESLLEKSRPSRTTANFLRVLLKNNRLTEISSINEKFDSVLEERAGVISATVTSSRELSEIEKEQMKANLVEVTGGKEIKLKFEIDKSVIGGSVTRVGSTVYDGSVKSQLKLLKEQMINS